MCDHELTDVEEWVEDEEVDQILGTVIAGRYHVQELIGQGSMGRIYKANQSPLDRTVAIKVLHKHLMEDQTLSIRFKREAKAASRIDHPNCIQIFDFGQTDTGSLYIAMEFIVGEDLGAIIAREAPIPAKRAIHICNQVLGTLQKAHQHKIIHRDLKPENIMLSDLSGLKDFVKICDFGIAKIQQPEGVDQSRLTMMGMICGTPYYMSPEQAKGEELDGRADLYSLGVILYELLTGEIPFKGDTPVEVIARHLTELPQRPSDLRPDLRIPSILEEIILKALHKKKEGRFEDAEALQLALKDALKEVEFQADLELSLHVGDSGTFSQADAQIPAQEEEEVLVLSPKAQEEPESEPQPRAGSEVESSSKVESSEETPEEEASTPPVQSQEDPESRSSEEPPRAEEPPKAKEPSKKEIPQVEDAPQAEEKAQVEEKAPKKVEGTSTPDVQISAPSSMDNLPTAKDTPLRQVPGRAETPIPGLEQAKLAAQPTKPPIEAAQKVEQVDKVTVPPRQNTPVSRIEPTAAPTGELSAQHISKQPSTEAIRALSRPFPQPPGSQPGSHSNLPQVGGLPSGKPITSSAQAYVKSAVSNEPGPFPRLQSPVALHGQGLQQGLPAIGVPAQGQASFPPQGIPSNMPLGMPQPVKRSLDPSLSFDAVADEDAVLKRGGGQWIILLVVLFLGVGGGILAFDWSKGEKASGQSSTTKQKKSHKRRVVPASRRHSQDLFSNGGRKTPRGKDDDLFQKSQTEWRPGHLERLLRKYHDPEKRTKAENKQLSHAFEGKFSIWMKAHRFDLSDLGSVKREVRLARKYAGRGAYKKCARRWTKIYKKMSLFNGIPVAVAKNKYERLRSALRRKRGSFRAKRVRLQLFSKVVDSLMVKDYRKMNRYMNQSFRILDK